MVKYIDLIRFGFQTSLVICLLTKRSQQQQRENCGQSQLLSDSANETETFPWMVRLLIRPYGNEELFSCSGTLISDGYVLTAAHCVHNETRVNDVLNIVLGAHGMHTHSTQIVDWGRITIPAGFENMAENDIALIALSTPAYLTETVQPICLPSATHYDYANESVVLTGWTQSNDFAASSVVPYTSVTTVISSLGNDGTCQQMAAVGPFSGHRVICADAPVGYGSVGSGGPMNFYDKKLNRWFILGVAGQIGASKDDQKSMPILFTRLTGQLDFVQRHSGVTPGEINQPTDKPSEESTKTTPYKTTEEENHETIQVTTDEVFVTTNQPRVFSCIGQSDGTYPNPAAPSCSQTFYMCSNARASSMTCPNGLVYRSDFSICDWPSNVVGCNTHNSVVFI